MKKKEFLIKNKELKVEYNNINEILNKMNSELKELIIKKEKIPLNRFFPLSPILLLICPLFPIPILK